MIDKVEVNECGRVDGGGIAVGGNAIVHFCCVVVAGEGADSIGAIL